ncbi:MAG: IPT/TIG domain-containing protein, partial [Bryobacteraceae bacterium]
SPDSNLVGAPDFTLTLTGGGFESDSRVVWNSTTLAIINASATQLTATVPASLLTLPGVATVEVSNPTSNPGVSQGIVFQILSPPPPELRPTLVLDQTHPVSNTQVKVSVTFDQNAPAGGVTGGLLTLSFTPAANLADDPSVFLDGNLQQTRAQPFTVPAGSNVAAFGSQNFVMLNTGTTAGTFTLKAALGDKSAQWGPYAIAPAAPVITSSTLGAAAGGLQLTFEGFDTSQSTSGLTFEFYAKDGSVVSPGLITMNSGDLTKNFSQYYQANTLLAGKFQVTATFPVTGDVTAIAKANVTLSNPSGTASATVADHSARCFMTLVTRPDERVAATRRVKGAARRRALPVRRGRRLSATQ